MSLLLDVPRGQKLTLEHKYIRCARAGCRVCSANNTGQRGHGPYWYAFWKEDGRTRSKYLGKELPPELAAHRTQPHTVSEPPPSPQSIRSTLFASGLPPSKAGLSRLNVQTFGEWLLTVERGAGSHELKLPTQKSRSLLTYLLRRQGHAQSRAVLVGLFWPESDEELARNSLSKALSHIRAALRADDVRLELVADRERVTLAAAPNAVCVMDATLFEAALTGLGRDDDGALRMESRQQVQAVEDALRLYRGVFLPGSFDEWAEEDRAALAKLYAAALRGLVRFYSDVRLWERAAIYGEALLQHDPLDESSQRQVMYLHYARGNTAAAIRQYQECAALLERELGLPPEQETTELYDLIRRRGLVVPEAPTGLTPLPQPQGLAERFENELPLVGRERPLQALLTARTAAQAGQSQLVLVAGEAGVGKSRLLQEAQKLTPAEYTIATARCYPGEGDLPYQPIITLLRALLVAMGDTAVARLSAGVRRTLTEMLPELELSDDKRGSGVRQNDSARFFEAVGYVVNLATQTHPLIVAVEDVHWASSSTLQLLTYLQRRLAARPVLLICSYRSEELPDAPGLAAWLNSLAREPHVQTIPLARLTPADVETIATHLELGTLHGEQASAWLYQQTEGNPLFIVESLRSLDENAQNLSLILFPTKEGESDSALTPPYFLGKGAVGLSSGALGANPIQRIVAERVARLPDTTEQTLAAASVLGRRFDTALVRAVAHKAEEDVLIDLDRLGERNFICEESVAAGETAVYNFVHDKVRETIYSGLSAARRQLLHRRAAETLERLYGEQAAPPSDSMLAEVLRPARTTGITPGDVALHFLAAGEPERAWHYIVAAGDQANRLLARREAIGWYDQALHVVSGLPIADVYAPATEDPVLRNHMLSGLDDAHALRLLEVAARRGTAWGDLLEPERATGDFRLMWDAARRIGRRDLEVDAQNLLAYALMWRSPEAARAASEDALRLSEEMGDLYRTADSLWTLGYNPLLAADPVMQPVAVSHMERALAVARQVGSVGRAITALTTLGYVFYYTHGAFDTALALYEQTLAGPDYEDESIYGGIRSWLLADAGVIYLTLWDIEAAESRLQESLRIANIDRGYWPVARLQMKGYALAGLALARGMAGDVNGANSYIAQAAELSEYLHHHHFMVLAEALLWVGRWDEARNLARTYLSVPAAGAIYNAAALKIGGIARWRSGDPDGGEEELGDALAAMDKLALTIYQWQVEAALARLTEARGRPAAALARYKRALATLERLAAGIADETRRDTFLRHAPVAELRERIERLSTRQGETVPILAQAPAASLRLVGYTA